MNSNRRGGSRGPERSGQDESVEGTPAGKLAAHIEELMIRANLTTGELAERCGVTPDMVRKWIRGAAVPHVDRWPTIAAALGLQFAHELLPPIKVK